MQYNDDTLEGKIPEEKEELLLIRFYCFIICILYYYGLNCSIVYP